MKNGHFFEMIVWLNFYGMPIRNIKKYVFLKFGVINEGQGKASEGDVLGRISGKNDFSQFWLYFRNAVKILF